jgi:hypothetical protein
MTKKKPKPSAREKALARVVRQAIAVCGDDRTCHDCSALIGERHDKTCIVTAMRATLRVKG